MVKNNFYLIISIATSILIVWFFFRVFKEENIKLMKRNTIPPFEFIDQRNDNFSSEYLKNKVYLVKFFFTRCPVICKNLNANMLLIQKEFINRDDFAIISFTVDPEYDNSQILRNYAQNLGAIHKNWFFLTGEKDKIYNLARNHFLYATKKDSTAEGGFLHTQMFTIVDRKGNVRYRLSENNNPLTYDGTNIKDIQILKKDIKTILSEK